MKISILKSHFNKNLKILFTSKSIIHNSHPDQQTYSADVCYETPYLDHYSLNMDDDFFLKTHQPFISTGIFKRL